MPSYTRGRNAARVGAIAVVSVLCFISLFMVLTDRGLAFRHTDLYVHFPAAERVRKGDAVLYAGVPVGDVRGIEFAPQGGALVKVRLKRPIALRRGAQADLIPPDLIGGQVVVLNQSPRKDARLLVTGDTIEGRMKPGIMEQLARFGGRFDRMTNDTMQDAVIQTVGEAAGAAHELHALVRGANDAFSAHGKDAEAMLRQVNVLVTRIDSLSSSGRVGDAVKDLRESAKSLAHTAAALDSASSSAAVVLGRMQRGEGTLGALLVDRALYDRSVGATTEIEALAKDLREHPKKYFKVSVF